MKIIALLFIASLGFIVRWSRWLAILQQKEYRYDRLKLFLKSREGKTEVLRLLPRKSDFSRTGFKRPRLTPRIMVVVLVNLFLFLGFFYWGQLQFTKLDDSVTKLGGWFLWLLILHIALPIVVMISNLPTVLISLLATNWYLLKAKKLLATYNPQIIAITGSFGKTSTKLLIQQVLGGENNAFVTPKSFNTKLSVARSICNYYRGQPLAILEYGAYSQNEIKELASWFAPDEAIISGLTDQHLGLFGSQQAIIEAKSELVSSLKDGGKVYYWADDDGVKKIVELGKKAKKIEIVAYRSVGSDVTKIASAGITPHGHLECVVDGSIIKTQLIGEQYLPAIVAAITVGAHHGIKDEIGWQRISEFKPTENFVRRVQLIDDSSVIDDGGTTNPKGFASIIGLTERISARRKILITGGIVDLGSKSSNIHQNLAKKARLVFDQVLYFGIDGSNEFKRVFDEDFYGQKEGIIKQIRSTQPLTLYVLEGRIPGWVKQEINKLIEKSK